MRIVTGRDRLGRRGVLQDCQFVAGEGGGGRRAVHGFHFELVCSEPASQVFRQAEDIGDRSAGRDLVDEVAGQETRQRWKSASARR